MATSIIQTIGLETGSLAGNLLLATPALRESCFARSVIYLCAHSAEGAMGMIINYPVQSIDIQEIFAQLAIDSDRPPRKLPVHFGGPVEAHRGFVLHSADYASEGSLVRHDDIAVTASVSILKELAQGNGPQQGMLVLGYAGWSPGQLEAEIESGSWITVPASKEVIFAADNDSKWGIAASMLGFDMGHYSPVAGHA